MDSLQDFSAPYEKIIFSRLLKSDDDVIIRRNELREEINTSNAFNNEYFIFYIMLEQQPKLKVFDKDYLKIFLDVNRALFEKSPRIDFNDYKFGEVDPYISFTDSCITLFDECIKTEVTDDIFVLNLQKYKMLYIQRESIQILEDGSTILSTGKRYRNKVLQGYSDMRNYTNEQFSKLDKVVEKSKRNGAIAYGITDKDETEEQTLKQLGGYGIKALDEKIKIYEGEMHSILAPAKGGKSRFVTHVLETCLVDYGQNCLMWSVENGQKGWEYLFRARHFNRIYNKTATDVYSKKILTDSDLRQNRLSPEMRELEQASWLAFRNNEQYGTLINMDEDLNIDTFIDKIDEQVSLYDIKIICVDYLQLIGRGKSNISAKNELIAEAYKQMLQYLKHKKIAGIFPCQFKQTVVGSLSKSSAEELVNMELRDAAGETYEVIKTPDVNLALYASVADLRNGDMKILSIPSRTSSTFDPIDLYVDLGSSTFMSVDKKST